jgi:hypothetical protein
MDEIENQSTGGQELAGLIAQAGQIDGEAAASSPEAMQAAQELQVAMSMGEQNAAAVGGMLELALPLICPLYPSLEAVYTPEVRAQVAGTLGPLLAKYGVNMEDMGGRYREEIAAAFVCGPIAIATYKGIKADIASRADPPKAIAQEPAKQTAPALTKAPSGATLKPGDYGYVEAHGAALAGA